MATQNVEFKISGSATADTGEDTVNAIRPINDGDPADQTTFRRPTENLRQRTEVVRKELEALKYLSDADRQLLLTGGGSVAWSGPVGLGTGTGIFTITADLTVRPFLSPDASTQSRATIRGIDFVTINAPATVNATTVNPPRAYNGANKITVELTGSDGATVACTLKTASMPQDDLLITIDTNVVNGTTRQQLITFLNNNDTFRLLGLVAVLPTGQDPNEILNAGGTFGTSDLQLLKGAADAEKHVITQGGLSAFFTTSANRMAEGDVLCIWYDELVMSGSYGGRRQSLDEAPEKDSNPNSGANVDLNLFLLKNNPERLAQAIPVARVVSDSLVFINGKTLAMGETGTIPLGAGNAFNIQYAGGDKWADGTDNLATTVEGQFDKIITDLGGLTGAAKIGAAATAGTPNALSAGTLKNQVDTLLSELNNLENGLAASTGATLVGGAATAGTPYALTAGTVRQQIDQTLGHLNTYANLLSSGDGADQIGGNPLQGAAGGWMLQEKIQELHELRPINLLHNSAFNVWRREGNYITGARAYASPRRYIVDRWYLINTAGTSADGQMEIYPHAAGYNGTYSEGLLLQRDATTTSIAAKSVTQEIERSQIPHLRGSTLALSLKVGKLANLTGTVRVELWVSDTANHDLNMVDSYGPNATKIIDVDITAQLFTNSTLLVFQSTTVPNTTTQMALRFVWTPAGTAPTSDGFFIDWATLVKGPAVTQRWLAGTTEAGEFDICQMYFESSHELWSAPGTSNGRVGYTLFAASTGSATVTNFILPHAVQMREKRTRPTITLYDLSGVTGRAQYAAYGSGASAVSFQCAATAISTREFELFVPSAASPALDLMAHRNIYGHWTADADY